jgi:hypothetical protein
LKNGLWQKNLTKNLTDPDADAGVTTIARLFFFDILFELFPLLDLEFLQKIQFLNNYDRHWNETQHTCSLSNGEPITTRKWIPLIIFEKWTLTKKLNQKLNRPRRWRRSDDNSSTFFLRKVELKKHCRNEFIDTHLKLGILVHYQKRNQLQQGRWPCDLCIQSYLPLFRHST